MKMSIAYVCPNVRHKKKMPPFLASIYEACKIMMSNPSTYYFVWLSPKTRINFIKCHICRLFNLVYARVQYRLILLVASMRAPVTLNYAS